MVCICPPPSPTPVRCVKDNVKDPEFLREIGLTILSLARHIPSGVLVFLSSYKLLHEAVGVWKETGVSSPSTLCQLPLDGIFFRVVSVVCMRGISYTW